MTLALRKHVPGRTDVNKAFSKENLPRLLEFYKKLQKSGGYHFGDLSAKFVGLTDDERKAWDSEIAGFYKPADVQRELARIVETALLNKDAKGRDAPIPIRFDWVAPSPHGPAHAIRTTFNPSGPHYHVELIGFPPPPASPLDKRRKHKELLASDEYEGS
jgi:hypothetical protein